MKEMDSTSEVESISFPIHNSPAYGAAGLNVDLPDHSADKLTIPHPFSKLARNGRDLERGAR
jgi:hypothetical protein